MRIYSYVVRYDSGFAPNPFYGFCTLATCKPQIRQAANTDDWVIGTGSACQSVNRGGYLVYAMQITEVMTHNDYWHDARFIQKRPKLNGSLKLASGDNIYSFDAHRNTWQQVDSYHSNADGSPKIEHINRDTGTDRVLISDDFIYFGGTGPPIPDQFRNYGGKDIVKNGQGMRVEEDSQFIAEFVGWIRGMDASGYVGRPYDWLN